jgi:hypothetical protein
VRHVITIYVFQPFKNNFYWDSPTAGGLAAENVDPSFMGMVAVTSCFPFGAIILIFLPKDPTEKWLVHTLSGWDWDSPS